MAPDAVNMPVRPRTLLVAGLHLGGDNYPNATHTLRILRTLNGVGLEECGAWLPDGFQLWRLARPGLAKRLPVMARLAAGNALSAARVLARSRGRRSIVYVPYPGIFLLWLLSWLPRAVRPRIIADAYVSLWDAAVGDRELVGTGTVASRLLFAVERRALRAADRVLVDTEASKRLQVQLFGLDPGRVRSLPLAIDEPALGVGPQPPAPAARGAGEPLRVLFVGTFIRLHGLMSLLRGIAPLLGDPRFEFTLVGDGQESDQVQALLATLPSGSVQWVRAWQTPQQLAARIQATHVCLGVFGGEGKAARVLPLKVYTYLALGRPVLTQAAFSLPEGVPAPPVLGVDPGSGQALREALSALEASAELRAQLSQEGWSFHRRHLSAQALARQWQALLDGL